MIGLGRVLPHFERMKILFIFVEPICDWNLI